ncbi:hypothetical protein AB0I84_06115 [Streptomyces spectabilis]|uniref:hypothetical protein n=1 Tax=Streptomyces spectabilis TaxID=68270 RepID=UPI00340D7495
MSTGHQHRGAGAIGGQKDTRDGGQLSGAASTSRPGAGGRVRADHKATARRLRAQPRVWGLVGTYRNARSADTVASSIRHASAPWFSAYEPAGSFEARTIALVGGVRRVEARCVPLTDDAAWADAVAALGQGPQPGGEDRG